MGVPCAGCGREYDVALFAFGRTIHCCCGRRVAHEARTRRGPGREGPPFLADAMLGGLARWLRILGLDTAWEPHVRDEDLVRRAWQEDRTILTRDRTIAVAWRPPALRLVEAEAPLAQLREVVEAFGLDPHARRFTRCSRCNAELVPASPAEARGHVPARVIEATGGFQRCPACGRFYWRGSHTDRMEETLARALAPQRSRPPGAAR